MRGKVESCDVGARFSWAGVEIHPYDLIGITNDARSRLGRYKLVIGRLVQL